MKARGSAALKMELAAGPVGTSNLHAVLLKRGSSQPPEGLSEYFTPYGLAQLRADTREFPLFLFSGLHGIHWNGILSEAMGCWKESSRSALSCIRVCLGRRR